MSIGNTESGMYNESYTAIYGTQVAGKVEFGVDESIINALQVFEMKDQGLRCYNFALRPATK